MNKDFHLTILERLWRLRFIFNKLSKRCRYVISICDEKIIFLDIMQVCYHSDVILGMLVLILVSVERRGSWLSIGTTIISVWGSVHPQFQVVTLFPRRGVVTSNHHCPMNQLYSSWGLFSQEKGRKISIDNYIKVFDTKRG